MSEPTVIPLPLPLEGRSLMCSFNRSTSRRVRSREEGMVTAEAAVVIPSLFVVLVILVTVVVALGAQLRVIDASREAARFAARGETTAAAIGAAERLAPRGAKVVLRDRSSHLVEAMVSAQVRPFGLLPGFTVRATALAERETP